MGQDTLHQPPSFDLPPLQPEAGAHNTPANLQEASKNQPNAERPAESQSLAAELPQASPPPMMSPGASTLPTDDPQAAATSQAAAPVVADDSDLIEKAWVEKAKSIVEGTRNDPYLQNKELNSFKADYMKKRYNKDIQVE